MVAMRIKTIAVVMGRGQDGKWDVVAENSFASRSGCHMSAVDCVCEVLWQATVRLTS